MWSALVFLGKTRASETFYAAMQLPEAERATMEAPKNAKHQQHKAGHLGSYSLPLQGLSDIHGWSQYPIGCLAFTVRLCANDFHALAATELCQDAVVR